VIGYPAWYQGGCADVERVMRDLFVPLLTGVEVVSWVPPAYATDLAAGVTFLRIFRLGGRINVDSKSWVDETRIQFAALSGSRDDSWELIEFVRQTLYAYRFGGAVTGSTSTTFIVVSGEVLGPQLIPEQLRDERLVPVVFEVHTDRPKGLPDYRRSLGLD
jgi:hypothetical protein